MRGILALTLIAAMVPAAARAAPAGPLPLLPMPASVETAAGRFAVAGAAISVSDEGGREAGNRLRDLVTRSGGPALCFSAKGTIRFRRDASVKGADAYRLVVTPAGATVSAASDAGLYYGAETLWQLIASSKDGSVPAVTIADEPAFGWRGVMLDSVRHFQPVAYVEQLIDRMALAKLNTLNWHLSDYQGWRIEIDRYPRLTKIGSCRQEAGAAGTDPATGKPTRYCGYYSKADIRTVVAYAAAHHVTIVPEIDMPGHATAMVAA
ncbi:MAG: family 20 glycosylhydrolase, partial [Sphingomonas sp.]